MAGEIYGSVTLDGNLSEWLEGDLLYRTRPLGFSSDIEIYGRVEDDAFIFATRGPIAPGAMTSLWLNTDRDATTGYTLGGVAPTGFPQNTTPFAGGAEYNVGITGGWKGAPPTGVNLYTGAEQQTLVASLDHAFGPGNAFEVAVPRTLIGDPAALDLRVDFSSLTWISGTLTLSAPLAGGGPTSFGDIALDGSLADWTEADRLRIKENFLEPRDGASLYGKVADGHFVFGSTFLSQGTRLYLNTDGDTATGVPPTSPLNGPFPGFAGGAEYMVELGSGGVPALYQYVRETSSEQWQLVGELAHATGPGATLEFALPQAALAGSPDALHIKLQVNESPRVFVHFPIVVAERPEPTTRYGDILLDGDAGDWAAAHRLDSPATGAAGFALWGSVEDEAFVFALRTDGVKIGETTSFFINADRDVSTGTKLWGWAAGAEYHLQIESNGLPVLWDGTTSRIVAGPVEHYMSADGKTLEFAIPKTLLAGAPDAIDVYADINNQVFLPNDYALHTYTVGGLPAPPPPPPAVFGSITIDGDLSDWSGARRLDDPQSGVPGHEVYGSVEDGAFVLAIVADEPIGAGTTLWFNADHDTSTGYQVWGWAVGAEFNIDFDAAGDPALYVGDAGALRFPFGDLAVARSDDGRRLEIAVPEEDLQSLLGHPAASADVYLDINNRTFLPNVFSHYTYYRLETPASVPVVDGVSLDGDLSDWSGAQRIDHALGIAGYEVYGRATDSAYILALKAPGPVGAHTTFWLNTDANAATGYQIWGWAGGAEFNVNVSGAGVPGLFTGDAGQTPVAGADQLLHGYSDDHRILELAIDKGALGGASPEIGVLLDVNNQVFLPTNFGAAQYAILDPEADLLLA